MGLSFHVHKSQRASKKWHVSPIAASYDVVPRWTLHSEDWTSEMLCAQSIPINVSQVGDILSHDRSKQVRHVSVILTRMGWKMSENNTSHRGWEPYRVDFSSETVSSSQQCCTLVEKSENAWQRQINVLSEWLEMCLFCSCCSGLLPR